MLPEPAEVNEINLESVPEALQKDWLDRSLNIQCDWIFLHAGVVCHAVVLDKVLSDIPILGAAVFPSPLLSKVTIILMPLIDCIKQFLPGNNYLAYLSSLVGSPLLGLEPSQYLTWFGISWGINFFKAILMNAFVA